MHLYHFDVSYDDGPWSPDEYGVEFASPAEARRAAVGLVADLACDHLRDHPRLAVRLRNGAPEPIVVLRLALTAEDRAQTRLP